MLKPVQRIGTTSSGVSKPGAPQMNLAVLAQEAMGMLCRSAVWAFKRAAARDFFPEIINIRKWWVGVAWMND